MLQCFAREIFHLGPWGSGARMKLAMNLVLGLNRAALAEGLAFAAACGLSMDDALRIFRAGFGAEDNSAIIRAREEVDGLGCAPRILSHSLRRRPRGLHPQCQRHLRCPLQACGQVEIHHKGQQDRV